MTSPTKVYSAKKIYTMSRNTPVATHVAVRDGRILGVGSLQELSGWGPFEVDDRFADKVLMPGFVEAHAHSWEGMAWNDHYLGFFERTSPDGGKAGGYRSIEEAVAALKAIEAEMGDPKETLSGWGFDPIYFDSERMNVGHLDAVSSTRPIMIMHASGHLMNVNSVVLAMAGITAETEVEGIIKGPDGKPTGELQEMAAMFMARKALGISNDIARNNADTLLRYAASANIAGVTTAVDLGNRLSADDYEILEGVTSRDDYPLRLVPALWGIGWPLEEGLARAKELGSLGNDKLHTGIVKIMTDGSIQGFTGRLKWPGYYNGAPNGIWNLPPEKLKEMIVAYHKAGAHIHIHVNGDQASEFAIDCFEEALTEAPRGDHRHTLQHCQMADAAQFQRMANLGLCANLFANHVFYWGDQHYALTMGPDRARRMDACNTALSMGVHLAIHCDAPVTPIAPLFTAWCAVNRLTSTGRVLGEEEKITRAQALHAITLGAAYQLKLDHLVGSIEIGKFADFAVLADDPFEVDVLELRNVPVWGTVVGGVPHQSAAKG